MTACGRTPVGMAFGRFQPFHNGHLEYVLAAAQRCRNLFIGITNPDPSHIRAEPADAARGGAEANPFPYHIRYRMVRDAVTEAGLDSGRLVITPYPVHEPELWASYVPAGTVFYLRVFTAWDEVKRARLQAAGYAVEDLGTGAGKRETGTEVRRLLRDGGPWRDQVPPAVARIIIGQRC